MLNRVNQLSVEDNKKCMMLMNESMVENWLSDYVRLYSGDANICDIGKEETVTNRLREQL